MNDSVSAPRSRAPAALWIAVGAVIALAAGLAATLRHQVRSSEPPFLSGRRLALPPAAPPPGPPADPLSLAGSGTNLPLTRRLAFAFESTGGGRAVVHASLGSRGGVLAARDRAVHLGLVSRALTAEERAYGLTVTPYARVAVVLAAHPTVPEAALSRAELLDLYHGRRTRWRDGSAVVVLLREEGDSSHEALAASMPGFRAALAAARRSRLGPVLLSDAAMQEALLATPGAVGLLDRGALVSQSLPLRTVELPGAPVKELAFVCRGAPAGTALAFLRFVASPAGQELIRAAGYLPVGGPRP